jgi:hypothetical protein
MAQSRIQDRIQWGMNVAARAAGASVDAYRPSDVANPLDPNNRYLRLHALFTGMMGKFLRPDGYGAALVHGIFDAAYTQPGDYLVQEAGSTWFIASQEPLLPVLCVRTSRTVSFARAVAPATTGVNSYGGVTATTTMPLLTNWPASVMGAAGGGQPEAALPSDSTVPYWTVLLPALLGVVLLPADLMTDDLGRSAVVSAAEVTSLGWRLTVKQAVT